MQKLFFITSSQTEVCRQKYFYLRILKHVKNDQNLVCDFKSFKHGSKHALNHISTLL